MTRFPHIISRYELRFLVNQLIFWSPFVFRRRFVCLFPYFHQKLSQNQTKALSSRHAAFCFHSKTHPISGSGANCQCCCFLLGPLVAEFLLRAARRVYVFYKQYRWLPFPSQSKETTEGRPRPILVFDLWEVNTRGFLFIPRLAGNSLCFLTDCLLLLTLAPSWER